MWANLPGDDPAGTETLSVKGQVVQTLRGLTLGLAGGPDSQPCGDGGQAVLQGPPGGEPGPSECGRSGKGKIIGNPLNCILGGFSTTRLLRE